MLDKFSSKRAQISDTITWVVATVIIAVVIMVSVLATTFSKDIGESRITYLDDKKKDMITSKSIIGFLEKQDNVDPLKNRDYQNFEVKLKKFSKILSFPTGTITPVLVKNGMWRFELYENDERKLLFHCGDAFDLVPIDTLLTTNIFLENLKLKFGFADCRR
ncbi:hypothetical protein HYT24_01730 [Candidatus Pacearchaeota archaeon]|nr:hypothetical protein [Candidatus Pacearchaeota archaeon]